MHRNRCEWSLGDKLYIQYHDEEWGVPVFDDRKLFEFLILESAQAGLSWITVLRKRENYRKAFADFNPEKVALFGENEIKTLLNNEGIIRNRQKIEAAINNAGKFLDLAEAYGSFSNYIWGFVDGKTLQNKWKSMDDIPPKTPLSEKISKEMKKQGFSFFGPTICYAHMQATGLVNDHVVDCFRYKELT